MKRIFGIVAVISVILVTAWWVQARGLHVPIDQASVKEVRVWGDAIGHSGRQATPDEKDQIIRWFNEGANPRDNSALAGTTPQAGIDIRFNDGRHMGIFRSGSDFEVQDFRSVKPRYYWLKQADLRRILDELAKGQ